MSCWAEVWVLEIKVNNSLSSLPPGVEHVKFPSFSITFYWSTFFILFVKPSNERNDILHHALVAVHREGLKLQQKGNKLSKVQDPLKEIFQKLSYTKWKMLNNSRFIHNVTISLRVANPRAGYHSRSLQWQWKKWNYWLLFNLQFLSQLPPCSSWKMAFISQISTLRNWIGREKFFSVFEIVLPSEL